MPGEGRPSRLDRRGARDQPRRRRPGAALLGARDRLDELLGVHAGRPSGPRVRVAGVPGRKGDRTRGRVLPARGGLWPSFWRRGDRGGPAGRGRLGWRAALRGPRRQPGLRARRSLTPSIGGSVTRERGKGALEDRAWNAKGWLSMCPLTPARNESGRFPGNSRLETETARSRSRHTDSETASPAAESPSPARRSTSGARAATPVLVDGSW